MTSNLQDSNTNNNLSGENNMNTTDNLISALITHFTDNPQNFTDYRKNIESILRENIKPISSRSGKTGGDDNWRKELKQRFSGRGTKWVFVSLEEIEPTLVQFEADGIDCTDYRKNTTKLDKAWIRFNGPRVNDGVKSAAFEVRTEGSTIDHPKQLHMMPADTITSYIEAMPGTPKALKLEEDSAPMPSKPKVKKVKPVVANESKLDTLAQEINVELNESPDSNDPADWEAFLAAEGLTCFDEELDEL